MEGSAIYPNLLRFAHVIESEKPTIFKTGSALVLAVPFCLLSAV
jgi:hypothetical protein